MLCQESSQSCPRRGVQYPTNFYDGFGTWADACTSFVIQQPRATSSTGATTTAIGRAVSQVTGSTGANLNLTSGQLNFLAGNLANFSSLTIDVGGRSQTVGLNTKLTAAEVVAVEQVILGGSPSAQTIAIGANGAAKGGSIALNNSLLNAIDSSVGGAIGSLTIAKGVGVVDSVSHLSLSGGLSNYGTIQTASATSGNTDTISAATINNAAGASINSYGGGGGGGLVGADVALAAANSLNNAGTINSAHNLYITAPVINNTGSIKAGNGNINVNSNGALNVSGTGTWTASNGNINFAAANSDINVTGANLISQQVNFNAGSGNIGAYLGQVTGVVNASGNDIDISATTPKFQLGQIVGTGDPLIAIEGSILISNTSTNPPATKGDL